MLTEEDLSIQDIHCIGRELKEEFEFEVEKLVKRIKSGRTKSEAINELNVEEDSAVPPPLK